MDINPRIRDRLHNHFKNLNMLIREFQRGNKNKSVFDTQIKIDRYVKRLCENVMKIYNNVNKEYINLNTQQRAILEDA